MPLYLCHVVELLLWLLFSLLIAFIFIYSSEIPGPVPYMPTWTPIYIQLLRLDIQKPESTGGI